MDHRSTLIHNGRRSEHYLLVFLLGFLSLAVVLVPLVIMDQGYFIYYGDFVSQQLPFYELANDAVRSGGLTGWNWYTDLGSSFLGSYAFYLTGSPFFWLTTILPERWVLYAIPWLLCLKHALAALTAYCYIRRFVRRPYAAVIGGLLYAYSGFQLYNIFFNHFQDVTAFFPLMLIAMEELVNNGRRGWFAAIVALMAVISYFFFTGQVVFLILYFLFRLRCRDFRITWKKFLALAAEAVLGVCIACAVLLPAALAVMLNSRVSEHMLGQDMVLYTDRTRIIRIIQSFFMIPDAPARPNLFSTTYAKWASIGGYLPLFSMTGVIAFMGSRRRHWSTRLIWLCILCAFVPILNSMFYLFNASYYARWYYMPILLMAMMTACALDSEEMDWRPGLAASGVMLAVFGLVSLLPVKGDDGEAEFFAFTRIPVYFYIVLGVSALCWLGTLYLYRRRKRGLPLLPRAVVLTTAACVLCTASIVWFGKAIGTDSSAYIDMAIRGGEKLSISYETDDADFFRVDMCENYDNYPMFWGLASMRCFQSVVSPSIMEFYDSIGVTRDVASRPDTEHYTLHGLYSVKYYFELADHDEEDYTEPDLPGFSRYSEENGFVIYQNDHYIPMGFPYDSYLTQEDFEKKTKSGRERALIHALVLSDEQAERYGEFLTDAGSLPMQLNESEYLRACDRHAEEACRNFAYDAGGFSADITLDKPQLVFFSVPYDKGWTAAVNGEPVQVERVSTGFMAVLCEAGESEIVFSYELPGLRAGCMVSLGGIALLTLYLLLGRGLVRDERGGLTHCYEETAGGVRAANAYMRYLAEQEKQRKGEQNNGTSA